jgi:ribosomal protein S18 acetylase RimI-like enzyme
MIAQWSFRECRPEEAADLLSLWRKAEATVGITDTIEDIQVVINHSASIVLVAEQHDRIVGSVIGTFDGWRGNIYRLAVDPDYRRQGLARKLVDEVDNRLVTMGAKRITALVEKDHPWAVGFWDSQGYQLDQAIVRYVQNL